MSVITWYFITLIYVTEKMSKQTFVKAQFVELLFKFPSFDSICFHISFALSNNIYTRRKILYEFINKSNLSTHLCIHIHFQSNGNKFSTKNKSQTQLNSHIHVHQTHKFDLENSFSLLFMKQGLFLKSVVVDWKANK